MSAPQDPGTADLEIDLEMVSMPCDECEAGVGEVCDPSCSTYDPKTQYKTKETHEEVHRG